MSINQNIFKSSEVKNLSTHDWKIATPEEKGMDSALLFTMDNHIKEYMPYVRSMLIVRDGCLVFEKYYQNYSSQDIFVICSCTKTITATLLGIAIKEGYIKGIKSKIIDFFPEYVTDESDPLLKEISIENLLTMTSGFEWNEEDLFNKPETRDNPIKYCFGLKVINKPGKVFNYNTLNTQIISGIITKSTKMTALEFADRCLFKPLGIEKRQWESDPQGYNWGGMELYLRTRDMAKFGYLLLSQGIWQGKHLVPREWIDEMTKKYNDGGPPENESYGYYCWVTTVNGYHAYFAGGFGGQVIYIIPDLDIVIAISSNIDELHIENRKLIGQFIVPSVKSGIVFPAPAL